MQEGKEREIQLQFLDEVQDHLQVLDSTFTSLSSRRIEGIDMNAALRAAHSMKGGGSLMGFPLLSRFSHQLEDFLKVMKVQSHSVVWDRELEVLLLSAVDCLQSIVNSNRQHLSISETWLNESVHPIFHQLHDRLGDPQDENAETLLSPEEGQDVVPILFETEVEGCLQRIEALLAQPEPPCLYEEVLILAQELGGLGAMLQLDAFSQLCASIAYAMNSAPDKVLEIAQIAVGAWRRSQSLVLTQQLDLLPTSIQVEGLSIQLDPNLDPIDILSNISTSFDDSDLPDIDVQEIDMFGMDEGDHLTVTMSDEASRNECVTHLPEVTALEASSCIESFAEDSTQWIETSIETFSNDSDVLNERSDHRVFDQESLGNLCNDALPLPLEEVGNSSDNDWLFGATETQPNAPQDSVSINEISEDQGDEGSPTLQSESDLMVSFGPTGSPMVDDFSDSSDSSENTWTLDHVFAEWDNEDANANVIDSTELLDQHSLTLLADDTSDENTALQTNIELLDVNASNVDVSENEITLPCDRVSSGLSPSSSPDAFAEPAISHQDDTDNHTIPVFSQANDTLSRLPHNDSQSLKSTIETQEEIAPAPFAPLQIDSTPTLPLGPLAKELDISATEFQLVNSNTSRSLSLEDTDENGVVRVGTKYLNQLNDLFGELTIDRNGLALHLKRLRTVVTLLSRRVQGLEQVNSYLRAAYDQGSTSNLNQDIVTQFPMHHKDDGTWEQTAPFTPSKSDSEMILEESLTDEFLLVPSPLSNDFDTLELDRYTDLHHLFQSVMEGIVQVQEIVEDLDLSLDDSEQSARSLNKTARQLQSTLMNARMRPLSDVASRFTRFLRELSLKHQKPVELKLQGGSTLIDRTILDSLSEPLMHIVRNAFDHGIESPAIRRASGKPEVGQIEVRAYHRGNRIIISVTDDGQGIAIERVRARARQMGLDEMLLANASEEELLPLIFEPGFSTAKETTDLSGRGVGMDVVRDRLQQLHGDIKITTRIGQGTTFSLSLPLTLSVTRVLLVESNGMLMAVPKDAVDAMIILEANQILPTVGREVFEYQGKMAELIRLSHWLKFYCPRTVPDALEIAPSISTPSVFIVKRGTQVTGLEVERCWREQEVTIRRVTGTLPLPEGFSSCTILGDGRVVPLVNIPALLHWISSQKNSTIASPLLPSYTVAGFLDTPPLSSTLPLEELHRFSGTSTPKPETTVNESFTRHPATIFSNTSVSQPLQTTAPTYSDSQFNVYSLSQQPNVLVVDDSIAVRRLLALTLEKASYRVEQAKDGQDALEKLNKGKFVDLIISDLEMPRLDGYRLLAKLQASDRLRHVPVIILTSRSSDKHRKLAMSLGAIDYVSKPYSEKELLDRLAEIIGNQQP